MRWQHFYLNILDLYDLWNNQKMFSQQKTCQPVYYKAKYPSHVRKTWKQSQCQNADSTTQIIAHPYQPICSITFTCKSFTLSKLLCFWEFKKFWPTDAKFTGKSISNSCKMISAMFQGCTLVSGLWVLSGRHTHTESLVFPTFTCNWSTESTEFRLHLTCFNSRGNSELTCTLLWMQNLCISIKLSEHLHWKLSVKLQQKMKLQLQNVGFFERCMSKF